MKKDICDRLPSSLKATLTSHALPRTLSMWGSCTASQVTSSNQVLRHFRKLTELDDDAYYINMPVVDHKGDSYIKNHYDPLGKILLDGHSIHYITQTVHGTAIYAAPSTGQSTTPGLFSALRHGSHRWRSCLGYI